MHVVIFDLDHTLFATDNTLYGGVNELLPILNRLGVHVAGLSNHDQRIFTRLEEAGIRQFFAEILCIDQHNRPKEPAGVHHVLSKFNAKPHHAVLVSHKHADILLGKDVGVRKTIGVTHGKDSNGPLKDAGADHIVSDVPEVLDVLWLVK